MSENNKNPRRSQWVVLNRCLNLLLRVMRGSTSNQELLEIVYADAHQSGEDLRESAARKRFEEDKARLRDSFGVKLKYDRSNDEYSLDCIGRPLLDLPDDAVQGLAFLDQTFSDNAVPMQQEVQQLLAHIKMLLPKATQKSLQRKRTLLEVDLRTRDSDMIAEEVFDMVGTACAEQRQLEFDYLSPQQVDEMPRRHCVEPMRYFFDTTRRHHYLEAYSIEARGPHGVIAQNKVIIYRLGRIQNPQLLPKHFIPRRLPEFALDYEVSANIARLGVTAHFPKSQFFRNPDGSVLVRAVSHNLFFDVRTLLHYGANCRVVGGEEAIAEMKKIVKDIYGCYFDQKNSCET